MASASPNANVGAHSVGLRGRKKARRREDILLQARGLFAQKGIDATTMAEIADAVGVSTPTIFNYFGNKDGILIALISEGTEKSRTQQGSFSATCSGDFTTILVDMFTRVSERTLEVAGKRVWRYAEAASIRHPRAPLAEEYAAIERHLRAAIAEFLGQFDLRLRSGEPADIGLLAQVFYDIWNATFLVLITAENKDLASHAQDIRARLAPLVTMLFDPAFSAAPWPKV